MNSVSDAGPGASVPEAAEPIHVYEGKYVVWGPPGTGKTSFLAKQVQTAVDKLGKGHGGCPVCVCSLTRTAASEIAGRNMPIPKSQVGTLHAHAYRQLGSPAIAEARIEDWNRHRPEWAIDPNEVSSDLDDMTVEPLSSGRTGGELYDSYGLLRTRMVPQDEWPIGVREFGESWEDWKRAAACIDFTDMIELALKNVSTAPGMPQLIIADEAQDHSRMEYMLLEKWASSAGAIILAGDPYQCIYSWRGADPSVFLDPSIPEGHRRLLRQSWRVPVLGQDASLRWAEKFMSNYVQIEYSPRVDSATGLAAKGVRRKSGATYTNPTYLMEEIAPSLEAGRSVMICASCSYMLKQTVRMLRKEGIPFSNPRRLRRRDWNPLSTKSSVAASNAVLDFLRIDSNVYSHDSSHETQRARLWTAAELANWLSLVLSKGVLQQGAKKRLASIAAVKKDAVLSLEDLCTVLLPEAMDQITRVLTCEEDPKERTAELVAWLHSHATSEGHDVLQYTAEIVKAGDVWDIKKAPRVYVGTVHSFKGFEADHAIVFPDLSAAGLKEWSGRYERRDNVARTFYVAMTRASEIITFCTPRGKRAVPLEWFR